MMCVVIFFACSRNFARSETTTTQQSQQTDEHIHTWITYPAFKYTAAGCFRPLYDMEMRPSSFYTLLSVWFEKKCWFLNKPIKILFFKILQLAMYRRRRVVTPYNTKGKRNPPSVYLYKILFFKSDHTKTWHFYSLETLCAWTLKILPPLTKHIY